MHGHVKFSGLDVVNNHACKCAVAAGCYVPNAKRGITCVTNHKCGGAFLISSHRAEIFKRFINRHACCPKLIPLGRFVVTKQKYCAHNDGKTCNKCPEDNFGIIFHIFTPFNRSELPTTDILLAAIAKAASAGFSNQPVMG